MIIVIFPGRKFLVPVLIPGNLENPVVSSVAVDILNLFIDLVSAKRISFLQPI